MRTTMVRAQDAVGCLSIDGEEIEARLALSVVVESSWVVPYPAALIAAIMFDHRQTISDALENPLAMEFLSMTQLESLRNFHLSHWATKIRYTRKYCSDVVPLPDLWHLN